VRSDRHQWHNWEQYQAVHDSKISTYLGHFVLEDGIARIQTPASVVWRGILACVDGIEIKVAKRQEVRVRNGRLDARTIDYTYHAYQRRGPRLVQNILRYDNVHRHADHPDTHHKHEYDDVGREHIRHVGEDWPTLGDVIDEVHDWWLARRPGGGLAGPQ
jgi:hypothetical protein